MTSRRYAVIGTGAIGGFYGTRLQKAGIEVHFLLNRDYELVCQQGLRIESVEGDFHLPSVRAYRDVADMPPCDVVMVALKSTNNHLLLQLLPPIVKPGGAVLLMQNGLGEEAAIAAIVGTSVAVVGGLCFICSNKTGPGQIRHLDYGQVLVGAYGDRYAPQGKTVAMHQIAADFQQAGLAIDLTANLLLARWKKLVWNVPFNGLSVVLDATTEAIMADPQARSLAADLMQEVVAGAKGCHLDIPTEFIGKMLDDTAAMRPYLTSMKLDYDSRRPLEVEAICGQPIRTARAAGVALPKMEMLYQQLKYLDARNRA